MGASPPPKCTSHNPAVPAPQHDVAECGAGRRAHSLLLSREAHRASTLPKSAGRPKVLGAGGGWGGGRRPAGASPATGTMWRASRRCRASARVGGGRPPVVPSMRGAPLCQQSGGNLNPAACPRLERTTRALPTRTRPSRESGRRPQCARAPRTRGQSTARDRPAPT